MKRMKLLKKQFLVTKNKVGFLKVIRSTNQTTKSSCKVVECFAERGKPFTDGDFIKEIFINCSKVLFEYLLNKNVILSSVCSNGGTTC